VASGHVHPFDDRRIVIADPGAIHAPGCRPFAQRALSGRPQRVGAGGDMICNTFLHRALSALTSCNAYHVPVIPW
jgi:hypothetical protein